MTNKTYTLTLGSHTVTLKFNMLTLVLMKQMTGKEPIEELAKLDDTKVADYIEFVKLIVLAGMQANKTNGINVDDDFYDLSFDDYTKIIQSFTAAYTVAREGNEDTQQGKAA